MQRSSALLALSIGVHLALGCRPAAAEERIFVLHGGRCPSDMDVVSAGKALQSGASDCVLLDPALRARISPGVGEVVSAATCGTRVADIAGSGAVMCSRSDAPPLRTARPDHDGAPEDESVTLYTNGGRIRIVKGGFLQLAIKWCILPAYIALGAWALAFWTRKLRQMGRNRLVVAAIITLLFVSISLRVIQMFYISIL